MRHCFGIKENIALVIESYFYKFVKCMAKVWCLSAVKGKYMKKSSSEAKRLCESYLTISYKSYLFSV